MDRRTFISIGGGGLLALYLNQHVHAQVATRRIGFLSGFPRADIEIFVGQLRLDLALFDLGIDSKLRACDLVRLRVRDVWSTFSCTPETRFHQRRSTRWPAGSIFLPRTRGSFPKPYGIWLHSGSRRLSLVIARAGARRTRWWMPLVRTP